MPSHIIIKGNVTVLSLAKSNNNSFNNNLLWTIISCDQFFLKLLFADGICDERDEETILRRY